MTPDPLTVAREEVSLIRAVLRGYPDSIAKNDAMRGLRVIDRVLDSLATPGDEQPEGAKAGESP